MQELMYIRSCKSGRRACSQYVGELAGSVTVPGVVKTATVAVPAERFVPRFSERAAASECCWLRYRAREQVQWIGNCSVYSEPMKLHAIGGSCYAAGFRSASQGPL